MRKREPHLTSWPSRAVRTGLYCGLATSRILVVNPSVKRAGLTANADSAPLPIAERDSQALC